MALHNPLPHLYDKQRGRRLNYVADGKSSQRPELFFACKKKNVFPTCMYTPLFFRVGRIQRYGTTTLWLVHHLSNMVPKKMCVQPVWRPMLLHYVPKMWKSTKRGVSPVSDPWGKWRGQYAIILLPHFNVPPIYTIIYALALYTSTSLKIVPKAAFAVHF